MNMVFCRGCGNGLHISAPSCPACGYVQSAITIEQSKPIWKAVLAGIFSLLCFLNWFNLPYWDADMEAGLWLFAGSATLLASLNIQAKGRLYGISILSLTISILTMLILLGRMP